jgi:hypothetical protein
MRDLFDREAGEVRAVEAIALLCCPIKKWIGAFSALTEKKRMEP